MSIIAKDTGKEWELPPEGLHPAVCCDVVDMGDVETEWGVRHKIDLRWQLDTLTSEGKPHLVTRRFNLSLHEKSTLRPFLEAWRGKRFSAQELEGFELERLLGVNCQLQVIYNPGADRTFANVHTAVPPAKGATKLTVNGYIRVCEREGLAESGEAPPEEKELF